MTLNIQKLTDYGMAVLHSQGILSTITTTPVEGGYAGAKVYRHNLELRMADGSCTLSVVQKYTNSHEVRIMQTLAEVPGEKTVPEIIDSQVSQASGEDVENGNWFITPFYEGKPLTFEDEMPLPVVESLARVHAYFASRGDQIDWLWRMTADTVREMFTRALEELEAAQNRKPNPELAGIFHQLEEAGQAQAVYAALETLPMTLTHGDIHPGNIITTPEGTSVLLDWGNARIAPAMFDLANLVDLDSPNWSAYLAAWKAMTGKALDVEIARSGYHWATVMINLQYLPFCAGQWPDNEGVPPWASGMVERLLDAIQQMNAFKILG